MGVKDDYQAAILDYVMSAAGDTVSPTNWFVGLFTTEPTADDGTGAVEVTGGSYARVSTAAGDWNAATAADPSTIDNSNAATFITATANWGTILGFGLFVASTGGTPDLWGSLTTSKAINTDDTGEFAAGVLIVKLGEDGDTF